MDKIIVFDFGGQYCHLIARRIRDLGVYAEVWPAETGYDALATRPDIKGIILSGGAMSVYEPNAPFFDRKILEKDQPVLGICYGHQLLAHLSGGTVEPGQSGEYGLCQLDIEEKDALFPGLNDQETVWMNHRDIVKNLPAGFKVLGHTAHSPVAAFAYPEKKWYGVQFHPEVSHTVHGREMLKNFVFGTCQAAKGWTNADIVPNIRQEAQTVLSGKKAIIGLSGGVDSATAAFLAADIMGPNLTAVYVDTGLMRQDETKLFRETFSRFPLNLQIIDASDRFFAGLSGVTDPEEKRKIIGRIFVEVFQEAAQKSGARILIQGTIYSDRIESGSTKHSSKIKSHHNVGGLPEEMHLQVYEPLCNLYKDEVRAVGRVLGLPETIITRHVFPGPGLGIRILGEVTREKTDIVRRAGFIVEDELRKNGWYEKVWMAFAVLLPIRSVGIQGDARSYKYPIVVRVIESQDAMTAHYAQLPHDVLTAISTRITNEIQEVNRVMYDISNKPPATMEWE